MNRRSFTNGEVKQLPVSLWIGASRWQNTSTSGLSRWRQRKLAASTLVRDKQDIRRILPALGHYKLVELNKDILRAFYDAMRSEQNWKTGGLLAEKQWRASIPVFAGSCPMQWRQGISRTILHGGHTGRKARRRSGRWRMRKQCKGLPRRWKARA